MLNMEENIAYKLRKTQEEFNIEILPKDFILLVPYGSTCKEKICGFDVYFGAYLSITYKPNFDGKMSYKMIKFFEECEYVTP